MSTENVPTTEQLVQHPGSGARKTVLAAGRPAEQAMKCPRCDSPNTKFCYYNNYSLTQPRHFCKTCRRYWTKGGALRNVPIGGGCRKSRKMKPGSRLPNGADSRDSGSSSELFHGIGIPPAMDFQLGNLSFHNNFASPPFGDTSSAIIPSIPNFNIDPTAVRGGIMGGMMNYPNPGNGITEFGSPNIASSIESLSSMNQDLHWKLQQQRMAFLFGGGSGMNQKEIASQSAAAHAQRPQPIMFQNLDRDGNTSAAAAGAAVATEWFFDNSYAPPAVNPTPTPTNSGGNGNENGGNWNGVQGWNDMNHFGRLA